MKATQQLHNVGQSLWLDNITRDLLSSGKLKRYIEELSVTGLTSNPTIFDHDIRNTTAYDTSIREKLLIGKTGEAIFLDLALEDITRAADLFRPTYEQTSGVDGWVSLEVSPLLGDQLGIAIAQHTYHAYCSLLSSERWLRIYNFGARPQRLLWASTGTKDSTASDTLYIKALAAPLTVNTMPEKTLAAFADHGELGATLSIDGSDAEETLTQFVRSGIDIDALAAQLQVDGAKSFVKSWDDLMDVIWSKCTELKKAA